MTSSVLHTHNAIIEFMIQEATSTCSKQVSSDVFCFFCLNLFMRFYVYFATIIKISKVCPLTAAAPQTERTDGHCLCHSLLWLLLLLSICKRPKSKQSPFVCVCVVLFGKLFFVPFFWVGFSRFSPFGVRSFHFYCATNCCKYLQNAELLPFLLLLLLSTMLCPLLLMLWLLSREISRKGRRKASHKLRKICGSK